jgi:hypothetical protein
MGGWEWWQQSQSQIHTHSLKYQLTLWRLINDLYSGKMSVNINIKSPGTPPKFQENIKTSSTFLLKGVKCLCFTKSFTKNELHDKTYRPRNMGFLYQNVKKNMHATYRNIPLVTGLSNPRRTRSWQLVWVMVFQTFQFGKKQWDCLLHPAPPGKWSSLGLLCPYTIPYHLSEVTQIVCILSLMGPGC